MNQNDVLVEVGRMHLQIIQLQSVIDRQTAELAQLKQPATTAAPQA